MPKFCLNHLCDAFEKVTLSLKGINNTRTDGRAIDYEALLGKGAKAIIHFVLEKEYSAKKCNNGKFAEIWLPDDILPLFTQAPERIGGGYSDVHVDAYVRFVDPDPKRTVELLKERISDVISAHVASLVYRIYGPGSTWDSAPYDEVQSYISKGEGKKQFEALRVSFTNDMAKLVCEKVDTLMDDIRFSSGFGEEIGNEQRDPVEILAICTLLALLTDKYLSEHKVYCEDLYKKIYGESIVQRVEKTVADSVEPLKDIIYNESQKTRSVSEEAFHKLVKTNELLLQGIEKIYTALGENIKTSSTNDGKQRVEVDEYVYEGNVVGRVPTGEGRMIMPDKSVVRGIWNNGEIKGGQVLPTSKNRFKYNSNSTLFLGRDAEMKALLDMCDAKDPFLWIGICGQGGTGKSRLAYELCTRMTKQSWDVFAPLHYSDNKEILKEAIMNLQRDTLVCIDYAKQDLGIIENFIVSIIENPNKSNYKIRLLLIDRKKQDVLFDNDEINQHNYCTEVYSRHVDGIIELRPMEDDAIKSIVVDYIQGQTSVRIVSSEAIDIIMDTLKSVDFETRRPLYALFIADAWLNDEDIRKWDRKDTLEYLLRKERKRLRLIFLNHQADLDRTQLEKYNGAVDYLYAIATYSGRIRIADYSDIILRKFGVTANDGLLLDILSEFGILLPANVIDGWEPDLIGEYFCVDYFNSIKPEEVDEFFKLVIERDISAYIRFSELIYRDYLDVISESEWLDYMRNITFPQEYRQVRNSQFAKSEFLRNISFVGRIMNIQKDAFRDCVNLERILYPSSLENIGSNAFLGCTRLAEVFTEDESDPSIISIENNAFKDCLALERVTLPESLQTLGNCAFENCRSLKSIVIPQKIERIGNSTFAGCKSLKSVVMRENKSITLGDSCFYNCSSLVDVDGSENISEIEIGAFKDCVNLEEISLTRSLKILRDNVFSGCHSLRRIDLSQCNLEEVPVRTFFECFSLESVVLPQGTKVIGDKAFFSCTNLGTLEIPKQLVKIGTHVFGGCEKINHLHFPRSLETIGAHAFENCKELSNVRFDAPVKQTGVYAFSGCTNLSLASVVGLLASKKGELCGFEFELISDREFEFLKLYATQEEITIPDSVVRIGDHAFKGLSKITCITLPPSLKSIGSSAFKRCATLQKVWCPNDTIVSIGRSAFSGCRSLTSITGSLKVQEIQDNTFWGCTSLKHLAFSEPVNSIGGGAFFGCSQLTIEYKKREVPHYIGTGAFEGCNHNLYPVDVDILKDNTHNFQEFCFDGFVFTSIGHQELLFLKEYISNEAVFIPNTCIDIKNVQFSELKKMRKLVIPDSISSLKPGLFQGCTTLDEVELPTSIKEIPSRTFEGCTALKSIRFSGAEINEIPEGVIIGKAAFYKCSSLNNIVLPKGLTTIESYTFCGCAGFSEFVIPDTVEEIGNHAFAWCENLKKIHLPSALVYMGKSSFKRCISLMQVENLENSLITEIQNNMFESCVALEKITLPPRLQIIKGSAFKDCHRLVIPKDFLPSSMTKVEAAAFQGCYSLEAIIIPRGISIIEDYTFKDCSSLREVVLSDNIKHIGQSSFYHCHSLCSEGFSLPEYLETMGICALAFCRSLCELTIPETVKELPNGLFKGCNMLKSVKLPETIEEIPIDCFKDCISLERIELPDSVKILNVGAFRNCKALAPDKNFLPRELREIRESAFRYCDSLESIFIPEKVIWLLSAVFEGCRNLVSVEFEHMISEVGRYAFSNCVSLSEFPFNRIKQKISFAAFRECQSLLTPNFSDTIKTISSEAFQGCAQIQTFEFPNSVTYIAEAVLREAVNLKEVVIPQKVNEIRKSAFRDCIKLTDVRIKSSQISVESRAFMGCSTLDFIELPEKNEVQSDAFEGSPVQNELKKSTKVRWVQE